MSPRRAAALWIIVMSLLVPPELSRACGPFLPVALFTLTRRPDEPRRHYFCGQLGVIHSMYSPENLFAAYRHISEVGFTPEELSIIEQRNTPKVLSQNEAVARDVRAAWLAARQTVTATGPMGGSWFEVFRRVSQPDAYAWYLNCPDDAFRTARQTLEARITRFGAQSREVREWLSGQDHVFKNCSGGESIPQRLPAEFHPLIRADRDYQIAAAHFYAEHLDEAERRFQAIAQDSGSPWRELAPYLASRSVLRKATLSLGPGRFDRELMIKAQENFERILAEPSLSSMHEASRGLLRFIRVRLDPEKVLRQLGARLAAQNGSESLNRDLTDYFWLLKRTRTESPDELTDWLLTVRSDSDSALAHSISRLESTRSPAWLTASLMKVEAAHPKAELLVAAVERVPEASPAGATLSYHRFRLLAERGQKAEARRLVIAFLDRHAARLPVSSRNLFLSLRAKLADDIDEFLRSSLQEIAGSSYYFGGEDESFAYTLWPAGGAESKRRSPAFTPEATQLLNRRVSLATLASLARDSSWPEHVRRDLVQAVWVRAILLGNERIAREAAREMEELIPESRELLANFFNAQEPEARRFAAVYGMLKLPGLRPYVSSGFGRETPLSKHDSFRENWWRGLGLPATVDAPIYIKSRWKDWAPNLATSATPPSEEELPELPGAAERHIADREWRQLVSLGTAPNFLARHVIEYGRKHPRDPRVPEALHRVVYYATRIGCQDSETTKFSRASFQLLHRNYPTSDWARKTRYWY